MKVLRPVTLILGVGIATLLGSPSSLDAQILKKLKRTVERAAEDEALSQIDRLVRDGVACMFDDLECIEEAQGNGDDVYLTDEEGNPVVDEDGNPVTDPSQAATILGKAGPGSASMRPGEGAWARYDFVPGAEVLFFEDYSEDNVGDFPRRFEFRNGSFEIVEWQGERYVRALSNGVLAIPLPEALPDRFTLETSVNLDHGNAHLWILPGDEFLERSRDYTGSVVSANWTQTGIQAFGQGPESRSRHGHEVWGTVAPLKVMADGDYMKVYLGGQRVANVPNAMFPRTDMLYVDVSSATVDHPILLGPVTIAAGGADLYDRLEMDGRVATQGILFDVDSDRIRPESTPTLKEIAEMLREHPDLRISIEGHTDSDGDDAYNLDLSKRRAAAVREFLIQDYDLDGSRLESEGFGESKPAVPNDTPEGKQQNRRVELVRMG